MAKEGNWEKVRSLLRDLEDEFFRVKEFCHRKKMDEKSFRFEAQLTDLE
jgi:hypothetical protein